jgi:hypothetical protein
MKLFREIVMKGIPIMKFLFRDLMLIRCFKLYFLDGLNYLFFVERSLLNRRITQALVLVEHQVYNF